MVKTLWESLTKAKTRCFLVQVIYDIAPEFCIFSLHFSETSLHLPSLIVYLLPLSSLYNPLSFSFVFPNSLNLSRFRFIAIYRLLFFSPTTGINFFVLFPHLSLITSLVFKHLYCLCFSNFLNQISLFCFF